MKRIAIIVSSQSGHTKMIADHVGGRVAYSGAAVEVFNVAEERAPSADDLKSYDAVIVGCPVYLGDFPPLLVEWAWENREALNAMPAAVFTVGMNAADPRPRARSVDDRVLRNLLEQIGVQPWFVASFGGALKYTQYGFFKRCVLQGISAAAGGPTDTTRDFDLTDWDQVAKFAEAFQSQDLTSEFAAANRLPISPLPSWPMAQPRAA